MRRKRVEMEVRERMKEKKKIKRRKVERRYADKNGGRGGDEKLKDGKRGKGNRQKGIVIR